VASRRASRVDVQLTIPATNTDGSRPANISRVDVYAMTGGQGLPDAELLKRATRIGSVEVKTPRNPDDTVEADDPDSEVEPPEGPGTDQGATVRLSEDLRSTAAAGSGSGSTSRPVALLGPVAAVESRTYAAVGVNKSGRRGPLSKRADIPLMAAPPPPASPSVTYDETAVTVSWTPREPPPPPPQGVLESHPLVPGSDPAFAYHVYDVSPASAPPVGAAPAPGGAGSGAGRETRLGSGTGAETRLTSAPVAEATFQDSRIEWGARRCYSVRTVESIGSLALEGDASPPQCVTLADTFPPRAPRNLQTVPAEGAVNLIWDPNQEKDLSGYIVLRGASAESLAPVTSAPIPAPTYRDAIASGTRVFYAVEAVDSAGNVSQKSAVVEETAR